MHLVSRQRLTGVNRWFGERTLAAVVAEVTEEPVPLHLLRTLSEALDRLPLAAHQAGAGQRLQQAVPPGAGWGRGLIELAAELQFLSSEFLGARTERKTESPGIVQVALECPEFAIAEACLHAAVRCCSRLGCGEATDLAKELSDLAACASEVCLGGATGPIVAAARQRGIPTYRLDAESLVQLGEGIHQQRLYTAMTSRTSQIAVQVSTDKHLVNQLWARIGIPTAVGRLAHDAEQAVQAAQEIGWPVVVKPVDADYGRGVSLHLRTAEQVRAAYSKARSHSASGRALVQRYLRGASHRLLVVEGRLAAAVRREPIGIVGDGRHSVRELVEQANQDARWRPAFSGLTQRSGRSMVEQTNGDARWGPKHRLTLGDDERALLAEGGFAPETVPAPGVKIPLSHNVLEIYSNVTEWVHPDTRDLAFDAVRMIGLDVAGLDVIALDISRPLAEQGGGFLEINAQPALAIHRAPHCDRPAAVGAAIVSSLFPAPARGRVPLVIVLGDRRADEVVQLTAEQLYRRGVQAAVSTPEQTRCNRRLLQPASTAPADRLSTMMLHPRTEAAILRATLAEILQSGLGADRCDVLVLAGGANGAEAGDAEDRNALLAQLYRAARRCVVNLDDPYGAGCPAVAVSASILVSSDRTHPLLLQHLAVGRVVAYSCGAEIIVRAGEAELARFPASIDAPVGNALAAAAVFALGLETAKAMSRKRKRRKLFLYPN